MVWRTNNLEIGVIKAGDAGRFYVPGKLLVDLSHPFPTNILKAPKVSA